MLAMVEDSKGKNRKALRDGLIRFGIIAVILAIVLGTNQYDWAKFGREFSEAEPAWLLAAFLMAGCTHLFAAGRWFFLLKVQNIDVPYTRTLKVNLVGFFFSQFLPSAIGGDAIRLIYAMRQTRAKKAEAGLSILMDRVLGLVGLLVVALILIPFQWEILADDPDTRPVIIGLAIVLSAILGGMISAAIFPFHLLPMQIRNLWDRIPIPIRQIVNALYTGFHAHGRNRRMTFAALGCGTLTILPLLTIGWLITRSLHLDVGLGTMAIILAIVLCAMSVPLPGGHGIREGAFVVLFAVFGITRDGVKVGEETALACSVLFLGISLVWAAVGAVIYLALSHQLKADHASS